MRKLSAQQFAVSLDGFSVEEGTELQQLCRALEDPAFDRHFIDALARADLHIMGSTTYRAMAGHWPRAAQGDDPGGREIAGIMNGTPKVVFSRSLREATWPETRIAAGDTAAEVAKLKAEPGGEIVAHGGVAFVQSLARLELVDEYRLYLVPFAVGSGTSIFATIQRPQSLELISCVPFPSGAIELVYRRGDG